MIKRQLALQANAEASAPPASASASASSASSSTTVVAANGKAKNKGKVTGKKDSSDSTSVFSSPRPSYTNKQRVLIIASRGINARFRHLLEDLKKLIPHHKKDNKLDTKGNIHAVNEIAEVNSCNQIMYLECRKRQDLYMHLARTPQGPSVKFHVVNIHTMDELKLTGNCMIGSRPLLNFDNKFNTNPHMRLLKTLLTDAFGTPNGHPKSKPFVDRVMCFFVVKNNIWVRNYQMLDKTDQDKKGDTNTSLIEIGPRMVLIPIRIFSGSLGGATLYQNGAFVSPNDERSMQKKRKGDLYSNRVEHKKLRSEIQVAIQPPPDLMSSKNVFK